MPLDKHEKNALDTVQFNLKCFQDEFIRLTARVEALEAGAPLPAEKKPEIQPTLPPSTIHCTAEHFIAPAAPQPEVVPDIATGWAGGQRR
jgi:hypothetical protein